MSSTRRCRLACRALVAGGLWPLAALAQQAPAAAGPGSAAQGAAVAPAAGTAAPGTAAPAAVLPAITVTATRSAAAPFDVPASIDRVDVSGAQSGRLQVNLSDELGAVPGLSARDRQNYAQDVQLSVRGFGARSTFGIRGVRLYVDGIPATLPDGQGQITNADLGSADRIEVLRGPFSALYGNSSGGVVQLFTEDPAERPVVSLTAGAGSDGALRYGAKASGTTGPIGYVLSASDFSTDGYRDHSAAERQLANLKLVWTLTPDTIFTLIGNSVNLPKAQDPLGLSRAQYEADPRGVDPSALSFDTRKTVDQTQFGLIVEQRFGERNTLRVLAYDGHRNTQQYQSIPVATQASPLNPGGVISLGRDYHGLDLRWTYRDQWAGRPVTLVGGIASDELSEQRYGYQNFIGTALGVQGALRRNETNDVSNLDGYLQGSFEPAPGWTVNAGVRTSRVRFISTDHYIVGTNPDDSGDATYRKTLPVLGVMWAVDPSLHLYATAGRGFETPTLNELAYRPGGTTGLNFGLQPATSKSVEAGVKTKLPAVGDLNVAVFRTRTSQEIVTLTNVAGRATYQNAGDTGRDGIEVAWRRDFAGAGHVAAAYTRLDARYRDGFLTCTVTPCTAPNVAVQADNRIPGIAPNTGYAEVVWAPALGWRGGVEVRSVGQVQANDTNTEKAAAYTTFALQTGYAARLGSWRLGGFGRIDNLFARKYAGSLIVNEGNARYFEPAPGRTWALGVNGAYAF